MLLSDRDWGVAYASDSTSLVRDFYIPLLQCAVHYARETGYFSSTALAVAAEGFSALFSRAKQGLVPRPAVRLLTSVQLVEEDQKAMAAPEAYVEAILQELNATWDVPSDLLIHERLKMLAWLLREGYMDIRIGIPLHPSALYHPKTGLVTDELGNRLAFSGSLNESAHGWTANIENFHVFGSWRQGEAAHVAADAESFERRWDGHSPNLRVVSLPDALRRRLLEWVPEEAWEPTLEETLGETPNTDMPDNPIHVDPLTQDLSRLSREVLDKWSHMDLVEKTLANSPVEPWPHQVSVLRDALATAPVRRLLCDEVGLGKTVEVALIVRALALKGEANKVLFAVPAGLLRQWQDQLWSKGGWDVPFYENGHLVYHDQTWVDLQQQNPLEAREAPWIIISKTLLARRDRQQWIEDSVTWDVVVIDEAHNLRRQAPTNPKRPKLNQLLQTFLRLQQRHKIRHELLLTATPLQLHPIELYDLFQVLGIPGPWADENWFRTFYAGLENLRAGQWESLPQVLNMMRTILQHYEITLSPTILKALGGDKAWVIEQAVDQPELMIRQVRGALSAAEVSQVAAAHTPLQRVMSRHTRALLKEYYRRGLTQEPLPERQVKDIIVPMSPEEAQVYQGLEAYFVQVYRNEEMTRKGLGFMKTLYLRRLTSSLAAARQSLARRMQRLEHGSPENFEATELEAVGMAPEEAMAWELDPPRSDEVEHIRHLLRDLDAITTDSKLRQLRADMEELLKEHDSAIVFTQYTDSLDYLRDQLVSIFGKRLACYSGRGGERWNGSAWVPIARPDLLDAFREGETIRILLCTDAASEGFDLQSCAVLINYDMPWNPMRVEQRIGRIDRIGQKASSVEIRNYYYQDSVDQLVYTVLRERLDLFQTAIGPLQAVLGNVEQVIEHLLVKTGDVPQRRMQAVKAVENLRQKQERLEIAQQTVNLTEGTIPMHSNARITDFLVTLEQWVACYRRVMGTSQTIPTGDTAVVEILLDGVYQRMTANRSVYARYPEIGWLGLDQRIVRTLFETWAGMQAS
ncbi:DEAD/DEAH box helicase [Sulfobacillus thermosulfidooxidans]|uniref:DEAD/DEAH box helicase n=1 Tax=Sulfobacillus thermosulfidooxidans TaxID=28034 RepID=UPI00040206F0|nr:SNF2-related protein [Sulfobacillus thermosulfidooxidans]